MNNKNLDTFPVIRWHYFMRIISIANIVVWCVVFEYKYVDFMCLLYILGCAFRSFYPICDMQQIAVVDSPLSRVCIGRIVATISELAYVKQLSIIFGLPYIFHMIIWAEVLSWYGVITKTTISHAIENLLWTLMVLIICLYNLNNPLVMCTSTIFILFEVLIDLPMYYYSSLSKHYSVIDGIVLICKPCRISLSYLEWKENMLWMSLYFSLAVWSSIYIIIFFD